MMKIKCRPISQGMTVGEAMVSDDPISFYGDVDPETGIIINPKHQLYKKSIQDKILVFPIGRGSTVGSYIIYRSALRGVGPKGMICRQAEHIVAVGAIMSNIPMVDKPEKFDFKDNQKIKLDADKGEIEII